ncbi:uncharacterized protein LOC121403911 [Drosophila obscura]|uniref:uncharacterized protein LOC121403911 n=1 Tax=Drosophila obscura TaxID=7282 RepID=UPI001BB15CD2|nr:uncharacterized protein LOC121403911 [Drosophila obscura]
MKAIVLLTICAAVVLGSPPTVAADGATAKLPPDIRAGQTDRSINAETPLIQKGYATAAAKAAVANNSTDLQDTFGQPSTKSNEDPRHIVRLEKVPKNFHQQSDRTTKELTTPAQKDDTTASTRQADGQHHVDVAVDIQDKPSHRPSKKIDQPVTQHNRPQGKGKDRTDRHPSVQQEHPMATSTKDPKWTAHRNPAVHNEHATERHRDIPRPTNPQPHVSSENTSVQHSSKPIAKARPADTLKYFQKTRNSGRKNTDLNHSVPNNHTTERNIDIQSQSKAQPHHLISVELPTQQPSKPIAETAQAVKQKKLQGTQHRGRTRMDFNTWLQRNHQTDRETDVSRPSDHQQHYQESSFRNPINKQQRRLPSTQDSGRTLTDSNPSLPNDNPLKSNRNFQGQPNRQPPTEIQDNTFQHPTTFHEPKDDLKRPPMAQYSSRTITEWSPSVQGDQKDRRMKFSRQFNRQQHFLECYNPITSQDKTIVDWNPSVEQQHSTKMSRIFDHQKHSQDSFNYPKYPHDNLAPHIQHSKMPTANHSEPSVENDRPIESNVDNQSQLYRQEHNPPSRLPPHPSGTAIKDSNPSPQNENPTERNRYIQSRSNPQRHVISENISLQHSSDEDEPPVQQKRRSMAQYSGRTIAEWSPSVQGDATERRRQFDQQDYQEGSFHNPMDRQHNKFSMAQDIGRTLKDSNPSLQNDSPNERIRNINKFDRQPHMVIQDSPFQHSSKPVDDAGPPVTQHRLPKGQYNDKTIAEWNQSVQQQPLKQIPRQSDHQKDYQEGSFQNQDRGSRFQIDNPIERNVNTQDQPILQNLKISQYASKPNDEHEGQMDVMAPMSVHQQPLMDAMEPFEHQTHASRSHDFKGATYRFPYDRPSVPKGFHDKLKPVDDDDDQTTTEPSEESSDDTTMRVNKSAASGKKGRKSRRKGKNRKRKTKRQRNEAAKKRKRLTTTTEVYEGEEKTTEPDEE